MSAEYVCEQCGERAALCVSGWGYIAALCDACLKERTSYLKVPEPAETRPEVQPSAASA